MRSLFSKIDANSDGLIAWDEFLSFMVLSSQLSLGVREDALRPRQNLLDTAPTAPPAAAALRHPVPMSRCARRALESSRAAFSLAAASALTARRAPSRAQAAAHVGQAALPLHLA